ncbi:MAG TPA: radical SAM family heme chaperone HemW [Chitinophagales bacterium]|nr:radical SAM family heme chaperone HemW [Chitinophagales bacterium]HRG84143.1 radical SAM family heme chaperone HemW [Chitinophagales bacterium]HRH54885.1 radical SAM family heme chaperone HemW [Chitinophagales bacterium]
MKINENKAGIYIHIPFCRKACHYCNFHFSTSLQQKKAFLQALHKELIDQKSYLKDKTIQSIYFGGGTPSVLSQEELAAIMEIIYTTYPVDANAEITLEANPDDINTTYLQQLKSVGINRMSVGIQSFYERDLLWMNRSHTAEQAEKSLQLIVDAGFDKITADLIYGIPMLSHLEWVANIKKVIQYGVNHISCYALTVEPKTALQHFIATGKTVGISDQHSAEQFAILTEQLSANGFEHYEISNFAKNGAYALHNSSYWLGNHYLGVGPSAHSYNGKERKWNIANNALYIQGVENKLPYSELEILTEVQQMNELIMTSLRTMWGLDLNRFKQQFGEQHTNTLMQNIQSAENNGLLITNENIITISWRGKFLADGIISDLFFDD